jgi:hypothetical protein
VGEDVNPVDDDEVVSGQDGAQPLVMGLTVGEMEVAQHRDLVERRTHGRLGSDGCDARGVGMRPGDLDPHAGRRERRAVEWPADRGDLMPATDEAAGQEDERRHVAGGADRGERDAHEGQMAAMLRGAIRGPNRGAVIPPASRSRWTRPRCPRYGSRSSSIRASSARGSPASAQAIMLGTW